MGYAPSLSLSRTLLLVDLDRSSDREATHADVDLLIHLRLDTVLTHADDVDPHYAVFIGFGNFFDLVLAVVSAVDAHLTLTF